MSTTFSVLVISDDLPTRIEVIELLRGRRLRPLRARSIKEAKKAVEQRPNLIIVDQVVRGGNGVAWIKWLRERALSTGNAYYQDVPVIYCSSTTCPNQTFNLLRNLLQVSLIVHKPIVPLLLSNQIDCLLPPVGDRVVDKTGDPEILQFDPKSGGESENMQEELSREYNEEQETRRAIVELGYTYLREMPETLYEMRNQITTAALERDNVQLLQEAVINAHRIKGTAGTLGFSELSKLAGRIENLLKQYKSLNAADAPGSHEPIAGSLILVAEIEMWLEDWLDHNKALAATAPASVADPAVSPYATTAALPLSSSPSSPSFSTAPVSSLEMSPSPVVDSAAPGLLPQAIDLTDVMPDCAHEASTAAVSYSAPYVVQKTIAPAPAIKSATYPDLHREINWVHDNRKRAVIVDSKRNNVEALTRILQATGNWHVECVEGGVRALGHIEDSSPDLLILDSEGEDLSGFDICRMVRCHPRWANLQIIIVTADTGVENRQAIFKCGANDFIVKPIIDEEVANSLKSVVRV